MATENVKVLKIDTGEAQTSVKDLRNQLKQLKDTLLSTEKGTEEYNAAMKQAAEIQHTLKEQMEEVNASAMDFGQIAGNITKTVGGLVAGFQAAKATMNLFGVENEDIIKSLQKMQNLMALTQALPAIDNAIKGFKRLSLAITGAAGATTKFSKALISTGLGAAAIALGALIANWDKVTDAMKRWGIIGEDTKKKLEEQRKGVENLRNEIAKLEGDYDKWLKGEKEKKLVGNAKEEYEDLTLKITDYTKQIEILKTRGGLNGVNLSEWERTNLDIMQKQLAAWKNRQQAILDNADSYKELEKETKKHSETVKIDNTWLEEQINYFSKLREEMAKAKQELANLDESEEEDEAFFKKADDVRQNIENTINGLRNAFMTPEEQYAQEINALDVALKTKLIKEEEYNKLRDKLNKEQSQREIQRYAIAANAIGNIFSSLGDLMEEGSEEQKAFQIMGATINMLGGITAALAGAFTTHSGPWDIALAALQATSIAIGGAATIAKMVKTNDSNAASMASTSPATAAIGSVIAPIQYTQDVQGANIEGAIRDSKVYVTETDITDTQNRVKVTENEARY